MLTFILYSSICSISDCRVVAAVAVAALVPDSCDGSVAATAAAAAAVVELL